MKSISLFPFVLLLLLPAPVFCASPADLATEVMNDLRSRDAKKTAGITYSMIETTDNRSVLYFVALDGSGAEHRRMVSIDGKAPTKEELAEFEKRQEAEKAERASGKSDSVSVDKLADMIAPGSLVLTGADEVNARFRFSYPMKSASGMTQTLAGILVFDLASRHVSEIHVASGKPFKAGAMAKVSEFAMDLRFTNCVALNEMVPSSVHMRIKGTAMLFIPFDKEFTARFSDYARVP
jgi:hypothetical protein